MGIRGLCSGFTVVVALGCVVAGVATTASGALRAWSIVALGDSVPHGTNCRCRPYPELTAVGLTARRRRRVTATNDAVAGFKTSDVLRQLKSNSRVVRHLRNAAVVEIEVGANDVAYGKPCGKAVACYALRIPMIRKNLTAIVRRVRALASRRNVLVVLLDYWSVWLGGKYAAAQGRRYVASAKAVTGLVNAVIKSTAVKTGSAYVDLRGAFKGPSYSYDETHFLSSDGDHPNAAGHKRIAAATERVIEKALHRS